MKTNCILLLTLSVFSFTHAQTEKGKRLIGAKTQLGIGVSNHSVETADRHYLSQKNTSIVLTTFAGYFVKENLAIGGELLFSYTRTKDYDYNSTSSKTTIAFAPFARYYFGAKKAKPFVQGAVGIGSLRSNVEYDSSSNAYEDSSTIVTYSATAGVAFFVNDNTAFDLSLGYGGISGANNDDSEQKGIQDSFGLNMGISIVL